MKKLAKIVLAFWLALNISGCVLVIRNYSGDNNRISERRDATHQELDQEYTAEIKKQ